MTALPIATETLRLRSFRDGDVDAFIAYRNDPDVARFQYWEGISAEEALAFLRKNASSSLGRRGEWQQVAVALGSDDSLIGDIGVHLRADGRSAELGFTLSRRYQGRSLMREALAGLIDALFDQPELDRLEAVTDARNTSAMGLLSRLGFQVHSTSEAMFKGAPCHEHTYSLAREAWRAA